MIRKYGFPFRGYVSSRLRYMCGPDELTEDSRDCIVEPNAGRIMGRWGSRIIGETTVTEPLGLLELRNSMKSRQVQSLNSPSMDNGDPVISCLYTSEQNEFVQFGTMYARSTDGSGANYQIGKEYGSTHYPTRWKCPPVAYQSSGFGLTRGSSALLRQFFASGSRSYVQGNSQVLMPNLRGWPLKWNKRWNDSTTIGNEVNRLYPWGMIPPLFPPTVGSPVASASTNDRNFLDGDAFVVATINEDENGQWSMPFTPRDATITNSGHVTVGTVRTGTGTALVAYSSVTVSNVAKGPPGTRRRLIIRTNKVNFSSTTQTTSDGVLRGRGQRADEIDVHPEHFYVWGIIEDNVSTSIVLASGNDQDLVPDPRVRFDTVWPRPSRYAFELEGRIAVGFTRYHPGAFILAPTGKTASRDLNGTDTEINTTNAWAFRLEVAALVLQYYATYPGAPAETTIPIVSGSTTLQSLVDTINATTVASSAKEWAAQIVPGADPTAIVDFHLNLTNMTGTYTASGTTLTYVAGFTPAYAAVGMEVINAATNARSPITAVSSTTLTTAGSIGAGSLTIVFGPDTGDSALDSTGDYQTVGIVRVFNAAYPAIVPFNYAFISSLIGYQDNQEIYFTSRSPEQATATETFVIGNVRKPPASDNAGNLMGGGPLSIGGVVCYSKAIYTFECRKEGGTGEDEDFQLFPLNLGRGCIAPGSVVHGNGWVGYLTPDGYVLTDGRREVVVTGDIYDPGTKRGTLDEEIAASFASAEDDTDGSTCYAALSGPQIHLTFSKVGIGDDNAGRIVYDFSKSVESSGLAEVLDSNGQPYPWSAPFEQKIGPMGTVVHTDQFGTNGAHFYGETQQNPGSTGDGEIVELDMPGILYDEMNETTVSASWTTGQSNPATITAASGDFSAVAVGAKVKHASLNAAEATVLTKATNELSITVNVASTGTGSAVTLTFKGQEIDFSPDLPTDFVDALRHDKAFQNITLVYKCTAGTMTVLFSRDKNRTTSRTFTLPNSSDDFKRYELRLSQPARAPTDVGEFRVRHDGRGTVRPELWGGEAEVEVLTMEGG